MIVKKTIRLIVITVVVFLVSAIIMAYKIINGDHYLKSFNIISVNNISTNYEVNIEKVKNADHYEIIIYDEAERVFYKDIFKNNHLKLDLNNISYNQKYRMVIFAYDKFGDSITVNNPYTFTYKEPTFSKNNTLALTDNEDYTLYIDGDLNNKNYLIVIKDNDYIIKKEKVVNGEYIIPKELFSDLKQVLTVQILDGTNVINTINLYNNISPVEDIKIISPLTDTILDYDDVTVSFEGGKNATDYVFELYKNDRKIKEKSIRNNKFIISSEFFNKSEKYTIVIKALYEDHEEYIKQDKINFRMNEKDTLKPAYLENFTKYLNADSKIVIKNPNDDGNIYYTIDGSNPNVNGLLYKEPFKVENNSVLKTIVKSNKKNSSIVSEYAMNIGEKKEYRVYLSPSNQDGNIGVSSVGFTNEMEQMNDLTNYIETKLKEYNVKIYRNKPEGNINLWNSESKFNNCDIHLAIHSNGSESHKSFGIETWVNDAKSESYDLANVIQKDLMGIYYQEEGNRGVKYANGSLGEVNPDYVPFGLLLEIAHHDFLDDAKWIMEKKQLIGETIANSILKYFGII